MQIILLAYCVSQQIENRDFWIVSCNCKTAENKKIKLSHVKRWLLEKCQRSLLPCCQFNRSFYSGDWGSSARSQRDEGVHLDEPRGKTQYVFIFRPRMYFAWEDRNVKKGTVWDDCPLEIHLIKWWLYFGCFKLKEIVNIIIVIKKMLNLFLVVSLSYPFTFFRRVSGSCLSDLNTKTTDGSGQNGGASLLPRPRPPDLFFSFFFAPLLLTLSSKYV